MKKIIFALLTALFSVGITGAQLRPAAGGHHFRSLRHEVRTRLHSLQAARPTSVQTTVHFSENFDSGIPSTWQVIDNAGTNAVWTGITDRSGHSLNGTPFAIADSDGAGSVDMNTILESPVININSGGAPVYLAFDQYFNVYSGNEVGDVDVFDGSNWVTVLHQQGSDLGSWSAPDFANVEVTSYLNPNFKVRFHYYNANYDWYWAIDNVMLYTPNQNDLVAAWGIPGVGKAGDHAFISMAVYNNGYATQQNFDVGVAITDQSGNTTYYSNTQSVSGANLVANGLYKYDFAPPWSVNIPVGDYKIRFVVHLTGDEETSNDTLVQDFYVRDFTYTDGRVYTSVIYDADNSGDQNYFGYFDPTQGSFHAVDSINGFTGGYYTSGTFVGDNFLVTVDNYNQIYLTDSTGNNFLYGWVPVEWVPDAIEGIGFVEGSPGQIYISTWNSLYETNPYLDFYLIGDYPSNIVMIGADVDASGTVYGMDIATDSLYTISTTDASLTPIGYLGADYSYVQDIGLDDVSGTLYGALYKADGSMSGLFELNKTTGAATAVGTTYTDEYGFCAPLGHATQSVTKLADTQWQLYPNPATDYVSVKTPYRIRLAEIVDASGQTLKSLHPDKAAFRLDVSDLPPGMYLLRISGNGHLGTKSFIKK